MPTERISMKRIKALERQTRQFGHYGEKSLIDLAKEFFWEPSALGKASNRIESFRDERFVKITVEVVVNCQMSELPCLTRMDYFFARELGIDDVPLSSIQSALRVLQKKGLVGRYPEQRGYAIDDPNFKNWLLTIAK